ncbi:MAG TPA: hypothetical protein VGQ83_13050 [Polyangia bacterium]|jgi:hypothetical protein
MSLPRGPRLLLALALAAALGACGGADGPDLRPPLEAVADEEYAVLSAALMEHASRDGAQVLVVERATVACVDYTCESYAQAVGPFGAPPADAFEDFLARNAASATLAERFAPHMGLPVVLLGRDELAQLGGHGDFFGHLAEAYPGSHGVLMLGRVGFNRSMDLALVSIGNQYAGLGGYGLLQLYRKIDGVWVLQASRPTWIS